MRAPAIALVALGATFLLSPAGAEPPSPGAGRYELQPAEGGFVRLDRETGATAFCAAKGDGYACSPAADAGSSHDKTFLEKAPPDGDAVARLEARVAALEAQIKTLSRPVPGLPPVPPLPPETATPKDPRAGELPSDDQIDRFANMVERMVRRLKKLGEDLAKDDPAPPSDSGRL